MTYVKPVVMTSPAGAPARPRLIETKREGDTIVEAYWYCSRTGVLFHRGVVEIKKDDKES